MKVQYLGHASLLIEANGKSIVVDPFITPNELAKNIDFATSFSILLNNNNYSCASRSRI